MKTFTFYSYKGGVGRTLALANFAKYAVNRGFKVVLLDFDLEAPDSTTNSPSARAWTSRSRSTKASLTTSATFSRTGPCQRSSRNSSSL